MQVHLTPGAMVQSSILKSTRGADPCVHVWGTGLEIALISAFNPHQPLLNSKFATPAPVLQVQLTPGAMTAITSWFRVTGSTEDADPCMCAGQEVEIALAARDGYVNAVGDLEPNAVKATAMGPDAVVKFEPYEVSQCVMARLLMYHGLDRALSSVASCLWTRDIALRWTCCPSEAFTVWP